MIQYESYNTVRICFWRNEQLAPIRFRLAFAIIPAFRFAVAISNVNNSVRVLPFSKIEKEEKTKQMNLAVFPKWKKIFDAKTRSWILVDEELQPWKDPQEREIVGFAVSQKEIRNGDEDWMY